MQNKYKLPDHVKGSALAIVKSYEAYKRDIKDEENRILSLGGSNYESVGNERVFLPNGKGGVNSPTENKAMQLEKLHNSYKYRCVKAVESALRELPIEATPAIAKKIRQAIYSSCTKGRCFNFDRSGIDGLSRSTFYRYRNCFLFLVAKKIGIL
ncbi:MAG: hypothetical protein ACI4IM_00450 [Acutalibacteraceae bacterium]